MTEALGGSVIGFNTAPMKLTPNQPLLLISVRLQRAVAVFTYADVSVLSLRAENQEQQASPQAVFGSGWWRFAFFVCVFCFCYR